MPTCCVVILFNFDANVSCDQNIIRIQKSSLFAQSSLFCSMDALSYILDSVKLKGVVYQRIRFTSQAWGIQLAEDTGSKFWRLVKGTCFVRIPGEKTIKMKEGDFIFVPHGSAHRISGKPNNSCVPSAVYVQSLQSPRPLFLGDEDETILIGGHFEFSSSTLHPFIKALPKVILMDNTHAEVNAWMRQLTLLVNEEAAGAKPGSKTILGRLAEIIFILIIRTYVEKHDVEKGFLLALKDPRVSNSLKLMHEHPEKEWTLNQLATNVGMSRSLYCREFKKLVGETPLSYLTNWRILKARDFLADNRTNVSEIAAKVGYRSESAFNRLFKSKVGETPARYRSKVMA